MCNHVDWLSKCSKVFQLFVIQLSACCLWLEGRSLVLSQSCEILAKICSQPALGGVNLIQSGLCSKLQPSVSENSRSWSDWEREVWFPVQMEGNGVATMVVEAFLRQSSWIKLWRKQCLALEDSSLTKVRMKLTLTLQLRYLGNILAHQIWTGLWCSHRLKKPKLAN